MKILEIVPPWIRPWPPKSYGAIERVVWELGEALKRQGAEVGYAIEDGEVERAVREGQWDFVHCHTPPQGALLRRLGVPYVATTHWSQHWNDTPEGAESREFVDEATGHLALSERVYSGVRCGVIGQGVNLDELPYQEPSPAQAQSGKLLMVGTYQYAHVATVNPVERKRYRYAIRALTLMPDVTLTLAGPGVAQMLWDLCDEYQVNHMRLNLPGDVDRPKLLELMHTHAALLHAATQEVVALAPLESMAAGLPVICARPCNEYGDNVVMFDHWTHIPTALEFVTAHHKSLAHNALKYAHRHGWDRIAEAALNILKGWQQGATQEKAA